MFGEDSHWNDEKVQDQRIEVSYSDGFDETRGSCSVKQATS